MRTKKQMVFTAERCYLTAAVAAMIRQGKSVYEVGSVLRVHERLIEKLLFTDALRKQLKANNEGFTKNYLCEDGDPVDLYRALKPHNAYYHAFSKTWMFTGKFPKTFDGWIRKNANRNLFAGVSGIEKFNAEGRLPLAVTFEIINAHFNGKSAGRIAKQFNCRRAQLNVLFAENNMQQTVTDTVIMKRMREAMSEGADDVYIKQQFKKIPAAVVKQLKQQAVIDEKIKRLPMVMIKKTKRKRLTKRIMKERQLEMLNAHKCLRYFSLGNEVPQIARMMGMNERTVISLLRQTQAVA